MTTVKYKFVSENATALFKKVSSEFKNGRNILLQSY